MKQVYIEVYRNSHELKGARYILSLVLLSSPREIHFAFTEHSVCYQTGVVFTRHFLI